MTTSSPAGVRNERHANESSLTNPSANNSNEDLLACLNHCISKLEEANKKVGTYVHLV